jgi:hypothetical protein
MFKALDSMILYTFRSDKGTGTTIKDIIPFVDYLDHSIPNYNELDESLRRISGIGLIVWEPPVIRSAPVYTRWYADYFRKRKKMSLHKEIGEISNYLTTNFSSPELDSSRVLDKTEFNTVVKDYLAGFSI